MSESRNSAKDVWGERTPFRGEGKWPERVDCRFIEEPERWIQSACVLCSNGCGIDIGINQGRIVGVPGQRASRQDSGLLESSQGAYGRAACHKWPCLFHSVAWLR